MSNAERDPLTGQLLYPVSIQIHIQGRVMPRYVSAASWDSAAGYLDSDDFRAFRDTVRTVTITNREEA